MGRKSVFSRFGEKCRPGTSILRTQPRIASPFRRRPRLWRDRPGSQRLELAPRVERSESSSFAQAEPPASRRVRLTAGLLQATRCESPPPHRMLWRASAVLRGTTRAPFRRAFDCRLRWRRRMLWRGDWQFWVGRGLRERLSGRIVHAPPRKAALLAALQDASSFAKASANRFALFKAWETIQDSSCDFRCQFCG